MKLCIENIAKIKHAEILFDGITVIAGKNDTGKSTIGKSLYSAFNSLNNMSETIEASFNDAIVSSASRIILEAVRNSDSGVARGIMRARSYAEQIAFKISSSSNSSENPDIDLIVNEALDGASEYINNADVKTKIVEKIKDVMSVPEDKFLREIVERCFNSLFGGQISQIGNTSDGSVCLTIKDRHVELKFNDNRCVLARTELPILNKAFLIDDPYIVDAESAGFYSERRQFGFDPEEFLISWLNRGRYEGDDNGIISSIQAKDKIKEIEDLLSTIIPGKTIEKNGETMILQEDGNDGVLVQNLSMGIKAVFILKELLEKNVISEKDVIIFDEPEIHLHPEWQLLYAHILVMLQKAFNLTLVVTTHSHYFLEAINLYSIKHGSSSNTHFYLSEIEDGHAVFKDVSDSIEKIYELMADPITLLDNLRIEIEEEQV